jgi:hypothetical protein
LPSAEVLKESEISRFISFKKFEGENFNYCA